MGQLKYIFGAAILCRTVHVMHEGGSGKHYIDGPTDCLVAIKKNIDIWPAPVTCRFTTSNFVCHLELKGGIKAAVNAMYAAKVLGHGPLK